MLSGWAMAAGGAIKCGVGLAHHILRLLTPGTPALYKSKVANRSFVGKWRSQAGDWEREGKYGKLQNKLTFTKQELNNDGKITPINMLSLC